MTVTPMLADPGNLADIPRYMTDAWLFQAKIDGTRLVIECDGAGGVTGYNRAGNRTLVPAPVMNLLSNVTAPMTFDGELLGGTVVLFDLIEAPGGLDHDTPCGVRFKMLDAFVNALRSLSVSDNPPIMVVPTAFTLTEKEALIEQVAAAHGEGYIVKQVDSPYRPGKRSRDWRKLKLTKTVDCIVEWIGTTKQNFGVTVYDPQGCLVQASKPDQGGIAEVSRLVGDGSRVDVGDVVEVECLYVSEPSDTDPYGRLYQPTNPRIRRDKAPEECTTDQLSSLRTNKTFVLDLA